MHCPAVTQKLYAPTDGSPGKKKKKMEIAFQLALSVLELSELMQPVSDI